MKDIIKFLNYAWESFQENSQQFLALDMLKNIIPDGISQLSNHQL